jgi:F0F1-type ATP synthase membrane subunit a
MVRERVIGSPFEQFEIHRIVPMQLGETLDISITNSTIYMMYAIIIYTVLYKINIEKGKVVPGR